jgi:hypothetical protein
MRMATVGLLAGLASPAGADADAWVFFSPDSPGAAALLEGLKGVRVRPVLVAERFRGRAAPRPEFLSTIRAAGELRVIDEEGLALAERLGIRDLPAVALRRHGTWHAASGASLDVKELLACGR